MIGSKCSEKGLYGNGVTVNNMSTAGTFLNVFLAGTFFDDARRYNVLLVVRFIMPVVSQFYPFLP